MGRWPWFLSFSVLLISALGQAAPLPGDVVTYVHRSGDRTEKRWATVLIVEGDQKTIRDAETRETLTVFAVEPAPILADRYVRRTDEVTTVPTYRLTRSTSKSFHWIEFREVPKVYRVVVTHPTSENTIIQDARGQDIAVPKLMLAAVDMKGRKGFVEDGFGEVLAYDVRSGLAYVGPVGSGAIGASHPLTTWKFEPCLGKFGQFQVGDAFRDSQHILPPLSRIAGIRRDGLAVVMVVDGEAYRGQLPAIRLDEIRRSRSRPVTNRFSPHLDGTHERVFPPLWRQAFDSSFFKAGRDAASSDSGARESVRLSASAFCPGGLLNWVLRSNALK